MTNYYLCKYYSLRFDTCDVINNSHCPVVKNKIPFPYPTSGIPCINGKVELDWVKEITVRNIIGKDLLRRYKIK